MTFRTDSSEQFLAIFERYKSRIRATEGCNHLALLRDVQAPHIFFTYSHWVDESYLEQYRLSETFAELWPQVKSLFSEPAQAWTLSEQVIPL